MVLRAAHPIETQIVGEFCLFERDLDRFKPNLGPVHSRRSRPSWVLERLCRKVGVGAKERGLHSVASARLFGRPLPRKSGHSYSPSRSERMSRRLRTRGEAAYIPLSNSSTVPSGSLKQTTPIVLPPGPGSFLSGATISTPLALRSA